MDRRTFLRGAFGLVALAGGATLCGVASQATLGQSGDAFVTPLVQAPDEADGPVMAAGIQLARHGDEVWGVSQGTHLFSVDATGAELVRLADGRHTIDEMAAAAATPLDPADVASFFVTLGQAGYLANTVLVNLTTQTA